MTDSEKIARIAELISPDTASSDMLAYLLEQAGEIVLNKRYPFGAPEGATVPTCYENTQIRVAVELYAKMGAEGQTEHNENGIQRKWEAADVSPSLLRCIVPLIGSVMV